jgi:predicted acyltransferase
MNEPGGGPRTRPHPTASRTKLPWSERTTPRIWRSPAYVEPRTSVAAGRLASVDALRGLVMISILGGDGVARAIAEMTRDKGPILGTAGELLGRQFEHVEWEGFSFYDLVFPLFTFIVGVAIVFSLPRLVEREGRAKGYMRIIHRSALLFAFGFLVYGGFSNSWPDIRLLGVLQQIALCYLFSSVLFLNLSLRGLATAFIALLVGYWALLTFVPVPGVGAASFEPGLTLPNWVDQHFLPGSKLFGTWDPEGLLSTLPAIATCLLGVFAGLLLIDARIPAAQKSAWLIGSGLIMIAAGNLWGLQFPVIKNIWTSSFVLVAGGWSALLLGLFHQIIDVWGRKVWATLLIWMGANAIALYLIGNVIDFVQLAQRFVGGDVAHLAEAHVAAGAAGLLANAVALAMLIALAGFLYRRKLFLRV